MIDQRGYQTLESMSQAIWYNTWTLDYVKKYIHGDILEVGCGIGNFTKTLIQFGEVTAIDINKDYIKLTEDKVGDKAKVGFGDIESGDYFFKEKKFDTVICLNVLEHIQNDKKALVNIQSLLNDGGRLILIVPAHRALYGKLDKAIGHFRRYSKKQTTILLANIGFTIIQIKYLNMLGGLGWWVNSRILKSDFIEKEKISVFNLFAPVFLKLEQIINPPFGISVLAIAQK